MSGIKAAAAMAFVLLSALPVVAQDAAGLAAAFNGDRRLAAAGPLVTNTELHRAADEVAMRVMAEPGPAPKSPDIDAVRASLIEHLYVPMQLEVLVAVAGKDSQVAMDLWRRAHLSSLADPALEEIGTAVLWNPGQTGPNNEYIWVAVLAKPLRTPAESPASPRFRRP